MAAQTGKPLVTRTHTGSVRSPIARTRRSLPRRTYGVALLVLIVVVLGTISLAHRHKSNLNDVNVVKRKIADHYLLPTNEQPALATVTDSAKLQTNFAAPIKDGDKILIYAKLKRAIVYRSSIDRVIDVEPITTDSTPASQASSTAIPNINPFGN